MENFQLDLIHILIFFGLGGISFLAANIDDIHNYKKYRNIEPYRWFQIIFFTLLSIAIGLSVCSYFKTPKPLYYIVTISCGLCGGIILDKIDKRKNEIANTVVDLIKNKIMNSSDIVSVINNRDNNDTENVLEEQDDILKDIDIDDSNTYIDNEQSDYNPFENE